MMKYILIALFCTSLILITPFTVVAHENKITSNLIEESNVDRIVAQIRTRIDEKLEKYEIIPKVANILEIILKLILYLLDVILFRIVQVIFTIIFFPITNILFPIFMFIFIIFLMFFM